MSGYTFTLEDQGINSFLVYTLQADDVIDAFTSRMLSTNMINGLVPCTYSVADGNRRFRYDISSKISLRQFLTGVFNKKRLTDIFFSIAAALAEPGEFMLEYEKFIFDQDYVFIDNSNCSVSFVCLPLAKIRSEKSDIMRLFKDIIYDVQFDWAEKGDYLVRLISFFDSRATFSLQDFTKLLKSITSDEETGESIRAKPKKAPHARGKEEYKLEPQLFSPGRLLLPVALDGGQPEKSEPVDESLEEVQAYAAEETNAQQNSSFVIQGRDGEKITILMRDEASTPLLNNLRMQAVYSKGKARNGPMLCVAVLATVALITGALYFSGLFKEFDISANNFPPSIHTTGNPTADIPDFTATPKPGDAGPNNPEATPSGGIQPPDASQSPGAATPEPANTTTPAPTSAPSQETGSKPKPAPQPSYLNALKCDYVQKGYEKYQYLKLNPSSDYDINGSSYKSGLKINFTDNMNVPYENQYVRARYVLNQAYGKLTLVFSVSWDSRDMDTDQTAWINILGDGKLLASSNLIGSDKQPEKLSVSNLKKVNKLTIEVIAGSEFVRDASFIIGDPILTK